MAENEAYLAECIGNKYKDFASTPQLFGLLFYADFLVDSDKEQIVREHVELNRPLEKYLNQMYLAGNEIQAV